jgi:predicted phage terminase large subunit-like protein
MALPTLDEIEQELARRCLLDFTLYTYPTYAANWHHGLICSYLDKFISGDIKRLMIFAPPRSGKSELVSRRLPAYILGRYPDTTIIATSYGADLARRMNRDVQRIMDGPEYRRLFPDSRLFGANVRTVAHGSWLRNSDMFEVVGHRGYYLSTGVGGSVTGSGAHVAIIDDPVKNRKEANSPTYRQTVWEWYTSTLYTRLTPDGRVLLTVTRWHDDDLAGRLLALAKSDPEADQWTTLILPAVSEDPVAAYDERHEPGRALWETRWGIDKLRTIERTVGARDWASLYQQRPAPDEGEIFKRHHWRYWQPKGANLPPVAVTLGDGTVVEIEPVELPGRFDDMVQSWDLNFKDTATSDFVAGQVLGRLGASKYVLDYLCERLGITATMDAIRAWGAKWPRATAKLIEDRANGPAVIQMLRGEVPGLIAVEPEGGKVSRAYAAAPEVEAGNVFLPHPHLAAWTQRFVANAAAFPNAANDDDVDAFTQAIIRWQAHGGAATAAALAVSQQTIQEMFG